MKRSAVAKIFGYLLLGAVSISVSPASGQYYEPASNPTVDVRKPLNQLPPIVSAKGASQKGVAPATSSKGLFLPPETKNLPPIVSPGQQTPTQSAFGFQKNNLPPIVQPGSNNTVPGQLPANLTIPQGNQKSAGGVPIYQSSTPAVRSNPLPVLPPINTTNQPPIRTQPTIVTQPPIRTQPSFPPSVIQGSGTRFPGVTPGAVVTQDGSGTRNLPPVVAPSTQPQAKPLSSPSFANSLAPGDLPSLPEIEIDEPDSVVVPETVSDSPVQSSRSNIVDSTNQAQTPGTNDYFNQSVPGAPTDSGCANCGPGGCYDPAMVQAQNGCCGSVANAGYYLFADALFWSRADGEVQLSNFFGLNDFNFVGGARFTFGFRDNATEGRELTYFGTGNLDETETRSNAAGALQPLFTVDPNLNVPTGFINAVSHTQTKETQIHSLDFSKIRWSWDLLKTFIGVRYIYFDDSYSFAGTNMAGTNALFTMNSVNNLFGAHTGFELFYDVGYRTSASFTSKFGGYVNVANVDTNLFNFGTQILNQEEDDSAVASTMEFNFMSHFQLSPRSRFRFGYDLFLGWGLFTVQNNIPRDTFARGFSTGSAPLAPTTGTNLNTNNEPVFFHGPSVGFEIFR